MLVNGPKYFKKEQFFYGCTGKIPYFSLSQAKVAKRRFTNAKGNLEIYHCQQLTDIQDHWHMSSMSKQLYKQNKRKLGY